MTIFVYHWYSQAYAHFKISAVDLMSIAMFDKSYCAKCYMCGVTPMQLGSCKSQSVDKLKDTSSTGPRSRVRVLVL